MKLIDNLGNIQALRTAGSASAGICTGNLLLLQTDNAPAYQFRTGITPFAQVLGSTANSGMYFDATGPGGAGFWSWRSVLGSVIPADTKMTLSGSQLTLYGFAEITGSISAGSSGVSSLKLGILNATPVNSTNAYLGVLGTGGPAGANGDLLLIPGSSTTVQNAIRMLTGQGTPTERLSIDYLGRVTIAGPNIYGMLTVYGSNTNGDALAVLGNPGTGNKDGSLRISAYGSGYDGRIIQRAVGSQTLDIVQNSIIAMSINSIGNVGIGTTTPDAQLSLWGGGQATTALNTSGALGGTIGLYDSGSGVGNGGAILFGLNNSGVPKKFAAIKGYGTNGSNFGSGDIAFSIRPDWLVSTLTEAMRITSAGNVGIGTQTPKARFHSDVGTSGTSVIAGLIYGSTNTALFTDPAGLSRSAATLVVGDYYANSNGTLFNVYNYTSDGLLFVSGSGNIGIGTTTPGGFINGNPTYFRPDPAGTILGMYSSASESVFNLISNQNADGAHIGGLYFTRAAGQTDAHFQIAGIQGRQIGTGVLAGGILYFFAKPSGSGALANNPTMVVGDTNVGIGLTAPAAKLHSLALTEQLRLDYGGGFYASFTTNSAGNLTIAPTGGTVSIAGSISMTGSVIAAGSIQGSALGSSVLTGTAPLTVASSTLVSNLTANYLGAVSQDAAFFRNASNLNAGTTPTARLPVFIGSGVSHAPGIVPDAGSTAGTSRYLREDATWSSVSALGAVPVGGILAWNKSLTGTPGLPSEFMECNGGALPSDSPMYNGGVGHVPDLNGGTTKRFLRGSGTSGTTGGSDTHSHTITTASASTSSGAGSSFISSVTSPSGTSSTLPSYYEVVWVMRVK